MNIELIGTGAIYSKYNSACTLINDDMLVDVPNGVLKQLLNSNNQPEKIDKILITHMHGDHIADIPFLLFYMYKNKKITRTTTIIGPTQIEERIKKLFDVYDYNWNNVSQYIKFTELKNGDILENIYKIKAITVIHGHEEPAYGYIINDKLGVTGDASLCEGVEEIVKECDITIADCSRIVGDKSHMGINDLKYLVEKYNKTVIPTHIKDETREELNTINIEKITTKKDGYKFNL